MGIASFSPTALLGSFGSFGPLQGLLDWFTASPAQGRRGACKPLSARLGSGRSAASGSSPAVLPMHPVHARQAVVQRPLRVLRVVDTAHNGAQASAQAGRMVISGRMADVCAELDRLAALEANPRHNALLQ